MKDSIEKLPWNPLIKELTCQALAMCDDSKMTPLSSSVDDGRADIPLEFSEKFAELIVRECIDQMEKCFAGGIGTDDKKDIWGPSVDTFKAWNGSIKHSRDTIKQHFGVE